MQGSSSLIVPMFDGEKYEFWSIKMKTIFRAKKLWKIVEGGLPTQPTQGDHSPEAVQAQNRFEEASSNDMMALQILQTAVTDQIFSRIASASTSKEAWDLLKEEYQGSDQVRLVKLQSLRRDYENLKMYEGESLKVFIDKVVDLENQLTYHGEKKTSYQVVQKILISLPAKFDGIVSVLEQTKDLTTMTMSELIGILKAHEARLNARDDTSSEGAFNLQSKKRNFGSRQGNNNEVKKKMWCGYCKRNNHTEEKCFKKPKNYDQVKHQRSNKLCYNCGKPGHFSKACYSRRKERAHAIQEDDVDNDEDHMLFTANEEAYTISRDDVWLVDSGCTNHMTKEERYFSRLDKDFKIPIRVGNGEVIMTAGKGDITVITKEGRRDIKDVFLVPKLEKNLLSVPQMIKSGYRVIFENKMCIIENAKGREVMKIPMTHKSFKIELEPVLDAAMGAKSQEPMEIWHKRFGHISSKRLQDVQEKDLVLGVPKFQVYKTMCESCNLGKQSRKGFPKESLTYTKEKLEIVHTDVCGPMQNESLEGSRYFLLFLDDYTHMCWVYFLKNKSETFAMFKKFKALVEKETQCYIKILRSDGGGEYTSQDFKNFCEEEGIARQMTLPYSPQQNGMAERKNRTVIEMARTMLVEKDLPLKFWSEAVNTAVYLQNRLPTKAIKDEKTPMEKWCGHKPDVSHLKVFGSLCFVHIPNEKRKKLDVKSNRGIFIGYSNQSKGYRVFILDDEKIQVSRDVIFEENKKWNWQEKKESEKGAMVPISYQEEPQQDVHEQDIHGEEEVQQEHQEETSPISSSIQASITGGRNRVLDNLPRRFKSVNEIINSTPRVDVEEMAQTIESCLLTQEEPQRYEDAYDIKEWQDAMDEEISMIEKNNTWKLVDKPIGKNVISVKWIYRIKTDSNDQPVKYKARLVARGFSQEYGVDYEETFAPVSRHDTIKALIAYSAQMQWRLYQMDVKSAFLNGDLVEETYIDQPPGYIVKGMEERVLRLYKALYGLKQAPRAWYERIDAYFIGNGFKRSTSDAALYILNQDEDILIISLYVDDMIITGNDENLIHSFKESMKKEFEMTDLGFLKYFLGMEVTQEEDRIILSQERYSKRLVEKFGMNNSKNVNTPLTPRRKQVQHDKPYSNPTRYRSIVGGLLYLCASRADIMFASSYLSRYMSSPNEEHYQEAKRVLRYVKGTSNYGLYFESIEEPRLVGYSDSDWGGCLEDKKSTTGYVFGLGSAMFCWQSAKQQTVAQSTAEAEYMALCAATNQSVWLQRLMREFGMTIEEGVRINCDNKSAIAIGHNPVQHKRTKHIEIKYHFVREALSKGLIQVEHCSSEDQIADVLTKPLSAGRFEYLRRKLGIMMMI